MAVLKCSTLLLPVLVALALLSAATKSAHAQEIPETGGRVFGLVGGVRRHDHPDFGWGRAPQPGQEMPLETARAVSDATSWLPTG